MARAALPLPAGGRVTSPFGVRNRPSGPDLHTGVDLGALEGTPVYAVLPGRVVVSAPSGQLSGYGNVVVVEHGPELYTLYAHMSTRSVPVGAVVDAGAELGAVGRTAGTAANPGAVFATSGAHLHLEALSAWPPAGRDLSRYDVGQVLAGLGIVVPPSGPLTWAAENTAKRGVFAQSGGRLSAGFAALVLALLAVAAFTPHK